MPFFLFLEIQNIYVNSNPDTLKVNNKNINVLNVVFSVFKINNIDYFEHSFPCC